MLVGFAPQRQSHSVTQSSRDKPLDDITAILSAVERGEDGAWSRLVPVVYEELRRIARRRLSQLKPGQTLSTTDLVHESILKLLGDRAGSWENRRHFFGAASLAMRDILVTEARRRSRLKRGGNWHRVEWNEEAATSEQSSDAGRWAELLALDEALHKLEVEDQLQHRIVLLRYFGGLSIDEVAAALEVSPSTVDRQWKFARAWLEREMSRR
jgi:RNA polymerase sigma factor (TIGR02999 family)